MEPRLRAWHLRPFHCINGAFQGLGLAVASDPGLAQGIPQARKACMGRNGRILLVQVC